MKVCLVFILLLTVAVGVRAQGVVKWSYSAKKVSDKTYEVKITGKPEASWHIYSSTTPEGGPLPTLIQFSKNPLVMLAGALQERGRLVEKYEDVFDIRVKYFDGPAEFVQVVKLRSNAKTNLTGSVEYMACTDVQCLPPKTINFTVRLE